MMGRSYQEETLAGATGVELVVALYDGAIRFLHRAAECAEEHDVRGRRVAVKKALDIFTYLQARLRPDVGGDAASALSEFYGAMFALTLEASHDASAQKLRQVIGFVRNVRGAWVVAAHDPEAGRVLPRELRTREEKFVPAETSVDGESGAVASRWSA